MPPSTQPKRSAPDICNRAKKQKPTPALCALAERFDNIDDDLRISILTFLDNQWEQADRDRGRNMRGGQLHGLVVYPGGPNNPRKFIIIDDGINGEHDDGDDSSDDSSDDYFGYAEVDCMGKVTCTDTQYGSCISFIDMHAERGALVLHRK